MPGADQYLWGIDSHGVLRTPEYLKRFQSGAMNNRPEIRTLKSGAGLEVLDADNGAGYVAGRAAMARAIELARTGNIAAVGIINSNHCGAASLYARMALEHGYDRHRHVECCTQHGRAGR